MKWDVGIFTSMKGSRVRGGLCPHRIRILKRVVGLSAVCEEQNPNAIPLSVGALGRLRRSGGGGAFGPDRPHGQWDRSPGASCTCSSNPHPSVTCYAGCVRLSSQ